MKPAIGDPVLRLETDAGADRRSEPPGPAPAGDGEAYRGAMARAGRLLATRPRATAELRDRLTRAGYAAPVVEEVVERLTQLGLLDDEAFARQWVGERSGRRGLSALIAELGARGVEREIAERAVRDSGVDEQEAARELALAHLRRVASLPLRQQMTRIGAALARRGYGPEVVREAVAAVLPPEGWD